MRRNALIMAVVTTFLWAGSYILNKLAFQEGIGPLTLSGLRYLLASLVLLCLGTARRKRERAAVPLWLIALLGLLGYAIAQGLQYVGQSYLTPTQSSLFLSVGNTLLVMLVDMLWLRENQTGRDLVKLLVLVGGIALYYYPWDTGAFSARGPIFMLLSSVGYALNMTINRRLLTARKTDPGALVAKPMLVGAVVLLLAGLLVEPCRSSRSSSSSQRSCRFRAAEEAGSDARGMRAERPMRPVEARCSAHEKAARGFGPFARRSFLAFTEAACGPRRTPGCSIRTTGC